MTKVYCLPYAGGSKSIYHDWINEYKDVAEIIPVEYSGHGSRFGEELYTSADSMAEDVYNIISGDEPKNYIIFGHSMGSLIALLTAEKLEKKYSVKPKAVIIGGTRPPHLVYKDEKMAHLPQKEFMEKFLDLGQTDAEIMNEPELLDLLYDVFYADTVLGENYNDFDKIQKINSPMVVMTGLQDDEAPEEDMREWANYCNEGFEFKSFDAGHFFPFEVPEFADYFRELLKKFK